MSHRLIIFFLMIISLVSGYSFIKKSFFQKEDRSPSSIQKVFDYRELNHSILDMAVKDRMINGIGVQRVAGQVVIELGNFALLNEDKEKVFACGYYDRVSFVFDGQGVLVDGEKPELTIESGCDVASNVNLMRPIKIPTAAILTQRPSNTEYKFFDPATGQVSITLNHSPLEWPKRWTLRAIKFHHSQLTSRILTIPTYEPGMGQRSLISMSW